MSYRTFCDQCDQRIQNDQDDEPEYTVMHYRLDRKSFDKDSYHFCSLRCLSKWAQVEEYEHSSEGR